MPEHYKIKEFQSFVSDKSKETEGLIYMQKNTFEQLEKFVLENRTEYDTQPLELMRISAKAGIGKVISARNYVGTISMKDGTTIEILPKLYSADSQNEEDVKQIFLTMLKCTKDIPCKNLNVSNLKTEKMNVFELFIRLFIDEVYRLVKRGLKAEYIPIQGNETVFKGKLLFSQQLRHNLIHKERMYVEYDRFDINRSENRLIKSTLHYLKTISANTKNLKDITLLLAAFDGVDRSNNYRYDLSKCFADRNMNDYKNLIKWCSVFLMNKSFTAFSGSDTALALLFPMEKLFESYLAYKIKKELAYSQYEVRIQDTAFYLFDQPKKFSLRPDIVIMNRKTKKSMIIDTKWKLLSSAQSNFGISQADMYQMYAYNKKYRADHVMLLYPMTDVFREQKEAIEYKSADGTHIIVSFVDLMHTSEKIEQIKSFL